MPLLLGDQAVLEHLPSLRAFVASLGVPGRLVEDVAQDVLLAALGGWDRYDGERPLRAWLFGIARNLVRQEWRRWHLDARCRADPVRAALREHDDGLEPLALLIQGEAASALASCLQGLSAPARELVLRHHRDDERIEDIARGQHRPAGTLRMALLRAREALRACLQRRLGARDG